MKRYSFSNTGNNFMSKYTSYKQRLPKDLSESTYSFRKEDGNKNNKLHNLNYNHNHHDTNHKTNNMNNDRNNDNNNTNTDINDTHYSNNNTRSISKRTLQKRLSIKSPEHYNIYNSIKTNNTHITPNQTLLPPSSSSSKKKTLVLDLDETLIHSEFKKPRQAPDMTVKVNIQGEIADIYVFIRPFVKEFLEKMSEIYEIIIFTASLPNYANAIIDKLPNSRHILHRLYRHHCFKTEREVYVKEMKRLGRNIKDVIIIDNNPPSYSFDVYNGIPILTWHDDKRDNELLKMIPMLEFLSLSYVSDVRDYIQKFICGSYINYSIVSRIIIEHMSKANLIMEKEEFPMRSKEIKESKENREGKYYDSNHDHNIWKKEKIEKEKEKEKEREDVENSKAKDINDKLKEIADLKNSIIRMNIQNRDVKTSFSNSNSNTSFNFHQPHGQINPSQAHQYLSVQLRQPHQNNSQQNEKEDYYSNTRNYNKNDMYDYNNSQNINKTTKENMFSRPKTANQAIYNQNNIDEYTEKSNIVNNTSNISYKYDFKTNSTNNNNNQINSELDDIYTSLENFKLKPNKPVSVLSNKNEKDEKNFKSLNFSEMTNEINKYIDNKDYDTFKQELNRKYIGYRDKPYINPYNLSQNDSYFNENSILYDKYDKDKSKYSKNYLNSSHINYNLITSNSPSKSYSQNNNNGYKQSNNNYQLNNSLYSFNNNYLSNFNTNSLSFKNMNTSSLWPSNIFK